MNNLLYPLFQCERFEGNRECCGGCPRECRDAFRRGETLEKCRKYNMEQEECFYEPCPQKCLAAAAQADLNIITDPLTIWPSLLNETRLYESLSNLGKSVRL